MPIIPCNYQTDCIPCDPVLDTQEGLDAPRFLGLFRPPPTPRLSIPFEARGCVRWCFSEVSQAEADLCAQHQAEECVNVENFYSAEKSCEIICPSGLINSATIEPGTVISGISQADADARAEAVACRKASLNACSFVELPIPNQAQGVSCINHGALTSSVPLPANLSISGSTLTVAPGSFSASTQSAANALAAQYVTDYMNAGLASGELTCCETQWEIGQGLVYPPTAAPPTAGFSTSTFYYPLDLSGPWDDCNLSSYGDGAAVEFRPRAGADYSTWNGSVTVTASVASNWRIRLYGLRKSVVGPGTPYDSAADLLLTEAGVPVTWGFWNDGSEDWWVVTGYTNTGDNGCNHDFVLAAGESRTFAWQFDGDIAGAGGSLFMQGSMALYFMGNVP